MKTRHLSLFTILGIIAIVTLVTQAFSTPVQAHQVFTPQQKTTDVTLIPMERTLGEPFVQIDPGTKSQVTDDSRTPDLQSPTAIPDPLKSSGHSSLPDRGTSWSVLMSEDFEGAFPSGLWDVFDNNGDSYGQYYWDDDDFKPRTDYWSAWEANGGTNGLDPASNNYPNNLDSWMMYGPFDLSNCSTADFEFYYWNKSETNFDWFGWGASPNGSNVYGSQISGDESSWGYVDFSLENYLGDDSVWLAFIATSDSSITDVGAFVDDVVLWCGHETTTKSWTMMVYLDGDNNLESAAVGDFLEMASQGSDTNVAILAQMDRITGYDTSYDDWTDTRRFYITPGMTPAAANGVSIGEANMGDPETLLHFIRWAKAKAPASHYVLVMWDHGSGWRTADPYAPPTKGVSFDDTSGGDAIDSKELRDVLATVTSSGAYPIDIVGLDACMMAMAEIDNQIRPYGLVRVSSEETEPNDGWPYDTILAGLKANPGWTRNQLATRIVDDYYTSYGSNQTQSAVDLGTPYTTLNNAIETFANAMINNGNNWISSLYTARNASTQFSWTYYIDLWDFADWTNIDVSDPTIHNAAIAAENAVLAAVIHEHHGTAWPWARGISIYFPKTSGEYDARYDGSTGFLQLTANTHWDEWIHQYHAFASYPVMFAKTSPANGATNQPVSLTTSWGSSSGVTHYDICMDTTNDSACGSTWFNLGTSLSATWFLNPTTTYYWQVRSVNSSGAVYANNGTWWSLTTGPLPGAFNKSGPTNASTNVVLNPTLSWGSSSNATGYEYCYDTSNDNACSGWTSNGTSTSVGLSGLSQNTTYYWHVRALNSVGTTYSNASSTAFWSFATGGVPGAFNKSTPTNGLGSVVLNPTLTWASSTNAASYEYCYDTSNDNTCSSWINTGTSTSAALSGLSQYTTYYWHVRANNSFGSTYANGSTTAFWAFTTGGVPGAFNKSSPSNGATGVMLNPTLSWASSTNVTGYEYCYDTSNDNACSSWTSNGTSTSINLSGLSTSTTYYWHVRANNSFGVTYANGSSTAFWSFTTGSAPGAFSKSSPANGATNVVLNPSLSWGSSANATSYEYCYDTSNDSACSGWTGNGTSTSVGLSGLSQYTTYYWHVRALNSIGTTYSNGSGTAFSSFTTGGIPGPFNKSTPSNGAVNVPTNPTLSWTNSTNNTNFEYCYDTTNDNACSSWVSVGTVTSVALSGLAPNTTYYWQVAANNGFGFVYANGALSAFWSFTTSNAPLAFSKISPTNGVTGVATNPTLSWGASGEPEVKFLAYEYCYDTVDNSACDDTWISTGASTSVALSGLTNATTYYWEVRAQNDTAYTYADGGLWWSFTTIPLTITKSFTSQGSNDGWILESNETSGVGGSLNNTATIFNLGDSSTKQQYRGVLSFATGAAIPDNAVITSVTLKITKSAIVGGGNPVSIFQGFMADVKKGFLGSAATLQIGDFQAAANKTLGPFSVAPVSNVYTINLTGAKAYINKLATGSGLTQIRLRFKLDDNNNAIANYLSLFSGNNSAGKPTLIIKYYVP